MNLPDIMLASPIYEINLTVLLSVATVCLTAMGTLIKIWGKKREPGELPGGDPRCIKHSENLKSVEELASSNNTKIEALKDTSSTLEKDVAVLETKSKTTDKAMDEVKEGNKEMAKRLDDLLKRLLEWAS